MTKTAASNTVKELPGYPVQNSPSGNYLWGGPAGRGGIVYDIVWRRCPRRTPWMMLRMPVCSYPIIVTHLSFNFLCLLLLYSIYLNGLYICTNLDVLLDLCNLRWPDPARRHGVNSVTEKNMSFKAKTTITIFSKVGLTSKRSTSLSVRSNWTNWYRAIKLVYRNDKKMKRLILWHTVSMKSYIWLSCFW